MTSPDNRHSASGFTLIELMIALAIISILAAIAYPAYTSHIKRGQHSEALVVAMAISAAMEQYAADTGNYGTSLSVQSYYDLSPGRHSATQVYNFEFGENPRIAASFSIKAIPKAGGPLAGEGPIIVYSDGRKGWDSDNDGTYEAIDF